MVSRSAWRGVTPWRTGDWSRTLSFSMVRRLHAAPAIGMAVASQTTVYRQENSDAACRSDPEDPVAKAAEANVLEDDRRRDRRRLAGLLDRGADGPDEAPTRAGRTRRA